MLCSIVRDATLEARGSRIALRRVGRTTLRLQIVHEHAARALARSQDADETRTFACFEAVLEHPPRPLRKIQRPEHVSLQDLYAAKTEAFAVTESEFLTWLGDWPEWRRQKRLETVRVVCWSKMRRHKGRKLRVPEHNVEGKPYDDPIVMDGFVWSWGDLAKHWLETGKDFFHRDLFRQDVMLIRRYTK